MDFAKVVRSIDPSRILLTGNSLPRASAYHNMTEGGFTSDTEQQFATILLRDNPGPFNPICIHTSPAAIERYFGDRRVSYEQLLQTCIETGRSAGKPIYVEEFVPVPARDGLLRGQWQGLLREGTERHRSKRRPAGVGLGLRSKTSPRSLQSHFRK